MTDTDFDEEPPAPVHLSGRLTTVIPASPDGKVAAVIVVDPTELGSFLPGTEVVVVDRAEFQQLVDGLYDTRSELAGARSEQTMDIRCSMFTYTYELHEGIRIRDDGRGCHLWIDYNDHDAAFSEADNPGPNIDFVSMTSQPPVVPTYNELVALVAALSAQVSDPAP